MRDFLTIDPTTIVFVWINTAILFFVIKHFLFDRVNKILEERKNDIETSYKEADDAVSHAKELEADYNQKLAGAKEESAEIVRNAVKKAQKRSDEIIFAAKGEAEAVINKASAEIEREKKRAVNEIKDEISDIALMVAEKVVEKEIDKNDHERLIEEFISGIGDES